MLDIKEYLKQTKTVLVTQDAFDELVKRASAQPDKEALDDAYAHGYTAAESEFRKRMDGQPESAKEYCAECNHIEMCRWYPHEGCEFRSLTSAQPEPLTEEEMRLLKKLRSYHNGSYAKLLDKLVASAQPEWIPCSKEPDTDRNVFIARGTHDNMTACIGHYDHDYKQWYEDRNWFAKCLYDGLYWCEMPTLPEPWRGEQNE